VTAWKFPIPACAYIVIHKFDLASASPFQGFSLLVLITQGSRPGLSCFTPSGSLGIGVSSCEIELLELSFMFSGLLGIDESSCEIELLELSFMFSGLLGIDVNSYRIELLELSFILARV
jgi:hypothetical protein